MHYARTAFKLREQIIQFSGELSSHCPKVVRRFLVEAIYGIQARQSVRLTEIARALNEKIPLRKTQYRLCRQLGREELGHWIRMAITRRAAGYVEKKTLLILDLSDITKKYAQKMEYMATVRDGSEKALGKGYWTCSVIAAELSNPRLVPLYGELYSHEAPEFISENTEIIRAIRRVSTATAKNGIWVLDRGGDRKDLYRHLLKEKLSFLIRIRGDRKLLYRGKTRAAVDLARQCPLLYAERIAKKEGGKERVYELLFGSCPVRLQEHDDPLSIVVVRGFGQEPLMLLTTQRITKSRKSLWRIIQSYLTRWRIEETFRFIKQSYQLEDIRLLTYRRLQNMMSILTAVVYFAMVYLGLRVKMRILARNIMRVSRRVFGIPDFHFYALADGIRDLLFGRQKGLEGFLLNPISYNPQLQLFDP
jgi:hypothetical protein